MQIHNLTQTTKRKKVRRVGRGGKRGTYSGRGIKGQRARAGAKIRPSLRDTVKKIPKLRGHKFKSFRFKPAVVNLRDIDRRFKTADIVSPETLWRAGLVSKIKGKVPKVKILGKGEFRKKLTFKDVEFSRSTVSRFKISV